MRTIITATVALALIASAASADTMKNCTAAWNVMSTNDKAKTTEAAFSKMCRAKGYTAMYDTVAKVLAHASRVGVKKIGFVGDEEYVPAHPVGATGECKDGSWTMAVTHQGACLGHGGVDSWLPGH